MKKLALLACATITALAHSALAWAEPPAAKHPLVGKWQWTRSDNRCTEVYDYRADGTAPITSGAERTDNTFTVSADPDGQGFYRLHTRTTKDYGGKDCAEDDSNSTGLESTTYLIFSRDRNQLLNCFEASQNTCFGPLRRMP